MGKSSRKKGRKQTDIEELLQAILEEQFITFATEYRRGTYNVDFYIPDCSLSIQADQDYWHSPCIKCNYKAELLPRQKYQALKDKACISFHKRYKLSIMRFCGCEIKGEKDFVRKSIVKAMEQIKQGNLVYRNRKMTQEKRKGKR